MSTAQPPTFGIEKIYVKDASLEVPNAPDSVRAKFWRPAAPGTSCGSTEASAIIVTGTKNIGMPMPSSTPATTDINKKDFKHINYTKIHR